MTAREISERINFLSTPASEHPASEQKKRHVGAETGSQLPSRVKVHPIPCQALQAEERGRGVAAGAAQAAAQRNPLLQMDADASPKLPRAPPKLTGPMDQVRSSGEPRPITFDEHSASTAAERDLETVMEREGLVHRADFVIAVGAFTEELQAKVDLSERAKLDGFFQIRFAGKQA